MNGNQRWLTYGLAIGLLLLVAWCSVQTTEFPSLEVSYSRFKELVRDGQVEAVVQWAKPGPEPGHDHEAP